jgi:hypothetical protein
MVVGNADLIRRRHDACSFVTQAIREKKRFVFRFLHCVLPPPIAFDLPVPSGRHEHKKGLTQAVFSTGEAQQDQVRISASKAGSSGSELEKIAKRSDPQRVS